MRWISLPRDLTVPHLLDLQLVSPLLRERFRQLLDHLNGGAYAEALVQAERAFGMAKRKYDRYGQSLALLYEGEAFRHLMRWEEGLDCIRSALRWLELQVAPAAHYNEAVAVYQEGVMHFSLQATERVVETFSYAQYVLDESERHWRHEENPERAMDCRNVMRWTTSLLKVQESLPTGVDAAIVPVYEFINRTLIRTDAVPVRTVPIPIPREILNQHLPPTMVALQWDELPFPSLSPYNSYAAIRIPEQETLLSQGRKGDLLVLEVTGTGSATDELVLRSDRPFVRRRDGNVEFRSYTQDASGDPWPTGQGLVGIPRILLRQEDVHEQ